MRFNKANRLIHRWATVVVALPVIVILITGLILQWKKHSAWVQPPTQRGEGTVPVIGFADILEAAKTAEEAGIQSWDDVDRLDVRPGKGVVKVRSNTRWEVQIDTATGAVLQTAYRRSDLIESLHDGSFFHDSVKLWVFFPSSLALTAMWATGLYLFVLPYISRRKRRAQGRAMAEASANTPRS
ncbi:MAG: PepSY domain-containing protein [Planctomycetota bacterium]